MSVLNENQLIGASGNQGEYEIKQSCRFNYADSPYLVKTSLSGGNQRTWTFSTWIKHSHLGTYQVIFDGGTGSGGTDQAYLCLLYTSPSPRD